VAPDLVAVLALSAAAALLPLASRLHNDHFDRISRARQIAEYGEVPFRDFMDPGYFLTLYASALAQKLFGFNLLGEVLLNLAGMAAGLALVYVVASRFSGSRLTAFVSALFALMAAPRLYDYDKVFFYPLGIALCWLYASRPARTSVAALGIGTALAGLFRYDNGIFIMSAAMVTIAAVHWRRWRAAGEAVAVYAAAVTAALVPAVLFVAWQGGLADAVTQMVTYAVREGPRTKIFRPVRFVMDASASAPVGLRLAENASAWLYYVLMVLPAVSALLVFVRARQGSRWVADPSVGRTVLAAATLCLLANLFVMRDPIDAHVGSVAVPSAVLAAWVFAKPLAGDRLTSVGPRPARFRLGGGAVRIASGAVLIALTVLSLWTIGPWRSLFRSGGPLSEPPAVVTRVRSFAQAVRRSPPSLDLLPAPGMKSLVLYIRQCTGPQDRLMASWFAPDLYYFAGRGFAGGMLVYFGGHWSEPQYQRRILAKLQAQMPPIVIIQGRRSADFRAGYPDVDEFVRRRYRLAAEVDFDDPEGRGYQVFIDPGRPQTGVYGRWALPCFAPLGPDAVDTLS
jgi:hypothetical protein